MDKYKIISNIDNIELKKNNNKYKLNFITTVDKSCNIIDIIKQHKLYELLFLLNKDLIKSQNTTNCSDNNEDVLMVLSNFSDNSDDEDDQYNNFYISITNNIKISKNNIEIKGNKNNFVLNDKTYQKFEIDNLNINLNFINDDKIEVYLSFKYIGVKLPIYVEEIIGHFFSKILRRFKKYFE